MLQILNRIVQSVWHRQPGRRRKYQQMVFSPPACESLEDRRLLAAAGISTDVSAVAVEESSTVRFSINWQPTGSGTANSVGMNLRIHYDSSALDFISATDIYQQGFSAQQDTTEASDRDDGNASTDRVMKLLWVDLQGTWPSLTASSKLLTMEFQTKNGFGSTTVNISATSVNDVPLPGKQVSVTQRPVVTGPAANNLIARPTISWTPVPEAASYEVWINNLSTGANPYLQTTTTTTTLTPDADLEIGRHRVWVQGLKSDGTRLGWSSPLNFNVRTQSTIFEPVGKI